MEDYKETPTAEILAEIKQMEQDHEALKQSLLNGWDKLLAIEKKYSEANKEVQKRLNT